MCHSFDFYSFVGDFILNSMHCIWKFQLSHMVITSHKHKSKSITNVPHPFRMNVFVCIQKMLTDHNPASENTFSVAF